MKNLLIALVLFSSCASIQNLSGGDIDTIPPKVIKINPDSGELFVLKPTITIEFDEFVKAQNVNELLIISPQQLKSPSIQVKGKKVTIKLEDSLKENTTYSINFNGSIVDVNEANPIDDYYYIFSTGTYIDSLSYQGYVKDVITNEACKECNIHLYKAHQDSIVLKQKPDYITRTNESGKFQFNNLPPDSFLVYALQDKNKNLILDNEEGVSMPFIINSAESNRDTISVFPFKTKHKYNPRILRKGYIGKVQVYFSQPLTLLDSQVKVIINNEVQSFNLNNTRDTLSLYHSPLIDTTNIFLHLDTTVYELEYIKPNKKYFLDLLSKKNELGIIIESHYIIMGFDTSKINLIQDSLYVPFTINRIDKQKLQLITKPNPNSKIYIYIDSNFVYDNYNITNKVDTLSILPTLVEYPTLNLNIEISNNTNSIVQLIKGETVIHQNTISSSQTLTYKSLKPGNYKVLLIDDSNNNKIWDSGNPFNGVQPEKRTYSEEFEMRINWDKDITIKSL